MGTNKLDMWILELNICTEIKNMVLIIKNMCLTKQDIKRTNKNRLAAVMLVQLIK
jgi:hypothetical protein